MRLKMSAYRKGFDESRYIYLLIKDDELLKKYNKIWRKGKNNLKKEFDSEPFYNEEHLKAKVKSYNEKINTNFHDNKIQKEGSQFICLSVILIDSVFRTGKNFYPQVFLQECKCVVKGKKIPKYIIDNIEIFSDSEEGNSDEDNSDEENSDEENYDEEILEQIQIKKNSDEEDSSEEDSSEEISDEKKYITKNYLTIEEIMI